MSTSALAYASRVCRWVFNDAPLPDTLTQSERNELDWLRIASFALIHVGTLAIFATGVSTTAIIVGAALYVLRMFAITAFYHRYFSHRAYRTSRIVQFLMAILGCTAGQRGPLWWASHHREHHAHSDEPDDPHSPRQRGMFHSHTLWFLTRGTFGAASERIRDWLRYPELRWLERLEWVPFIGLGALCWLLGSFFEAYAPGLATSGPQMFVVGFLVSTVLVYHATYTTNSIAHRYGKRPYETDDDSRNNVLVALITLGEGWHNNHHYYPASARQGFLWWELDVSWLGLRVMRALGLVHDLKLVPQSVLEARLGKRELPLVKR
ncbi:MAG: acyl-CoA desaturase [Chromatiales bacterium]|jgi:stearoyl-CoA desaturase (Delta-9 desaturase)|nr:acyl-CoA desaturase [Chromatiales bacterium]